MGTKENFNQAMHEVFPFYKNGKASPEGMRASTSDLAEKIDDLVVGNAKEPLNFQSAYTTKQMENIETTRITKDTKITGTIVSKSNLDISGEVYGDIESDYSVKVSGKVEGDINAKSAEISGGVVKGNIRAGGHVNICNQSSIIGNVSADELDINSKINGNINAKKSVSIQKDSAILGDINAACVSIEKGALIKGMVVTTGESEDGGSGKAE